MRCAHHFLAKHVTEGCLGQDAWLCPRSATAWTRHPFTSPGLSFFVYRTRGFNHMVSNISSRSKVFRHLAKQ